MKERNAKVHDIWRNAALNDFFYHWLMSDDSQVLFANHKLDADQMLIRVIGPRNDSK